MFSEQFPPFFDNVPELCSAVPLKFRQTRRGDIMLVLHHNFNSCALALLSIKKELAKSAEKILL
jgi:hypothetical protein